MAENSVVVVVESISASESSVFWPEWSVPALRGSTEGFCGMLAPSSVARRGISIPDHPHTWWARFCVGAGWVAGGDPTEEGVGVSVGVGMGVGRAKPVADDEVEGVTRRSFRKLHSWRVAGIAERLPE